MDIKRYIALMALISLLVANGALAVQPGTSYLGAQYAIYTYSETGFPDFNPTALILRGGYNFNQYFSVEGRYGFGLADDTQNVPPVNNLKLELDYTVGVYALGHIPISKSFDLYGVAGFTKAKLTAGVPTFSISDSESDVSVGIGAEYHLQSVSFSLEYMSYLRKSAYDLNAIGIGANYNF